MEGGLSCVIVNIHSDFVSVRHVRPSIHKWSHSLNVQRCKLHAIVHMSMNACVCVSAHLFVSGHVCLCVCVCV